MEHISEIIMRLERKRIRKEYQHETVFQRMKRMFPDVSDDEILIEQLRTVLEATRGNRCSMLQDIRSGRETEIDALNGEICRRGEMVGLQTPLNHALASIIEHLR